MPFATTWNVPPDGPPPKMILFLANESAEKAKVNMSDIQIPNRILSDLFLILDTSLYI
jgi:hypothetical protein